MRTVLMIIVVLCVSFFAFAAIQDLSSELVPAQPKTEIAELEALISQAKASGQTPDPAWTARLQELIPAAQNHSASAVNVLPESELEGGFAPGAVILPTELTPLEQQIKDLEFLMDGGASGEEPDPLTTLNLKNQLRELYAQRVIHRERNPLDDGADACPATVISSVPFIDNGDTWDKTDNYTSFAPCTGSNSLDVIYSFIPTYTGSHTIAIDSATYDTYLYVRTTGACPGSVQVACDDDGGPGLWSLINMNMTAGTTYFIVVDGFSEDSGSYRIRVNSNCLINCQPSDIAECDEEILPEHANSDCNGACNNLNGIPTRQNINIGQTICGRAFTYTGPTGENRRDTDSYLFTLAEPCSVRITLNTEFPTQLFVFGPNCPFGTALFNQSWAYACSTVTYLTSCLPAGSYNLWVGPTFFTGMSEFRDYRVRLDVVPCSGCRVDAAITAPFSHGWHSCGAGNNNSLRPSSDYTYLVTIPHAGDWMFSLCNDDSLWNSYLYLSSACNSGVIASDNDGCGVGGLSVINCLNLNAGSYYLTVEGFNASDCGPFAVHVTECLGACCYGNPSNPVCAFISETDCDSLSGQWSYMEPCSSGACFTRPTCDDDALWGQLPFLPDESWGGNVSSSATPFYQYDNYSVGGAVSGVKFWGFMADFGNGNVPCTSDSFEFEITFVDSTPLTTQTYYVTLATNVLPPLYSGIYNLTEYVADISPPCTITDGWVRIASIDSSCDFFWSTTILGDGIEGVQTSNGVPSEIEERAFCLDGSCDVDSVTMIWDSPSVAMLRWWQSSSGEPTVWYTVDPNAVYPVGFTPVSIGIRPAGNNSIGVNADFADYVGVIVVVDCGVQPEASVSTPNPVLILRDESR